ncbi:MAG: cellulase family glycosylhydrolase [Bacteroidaceae bacterium]|nr:cellulase family glycosylhydrolase [Bacteroidaceae bacterium]
MKTLKYFLSLLAVASVFTACKKDDLSPMISYDGVTTPINMADNLAFDTSKEDTIILQTEFAANWRAVASDGWCRLEHEPGTPSTKYLTIIASENRSYEQRSATITFEYIHNTSIKKVVSLTQPGKAKWNYTNENAAAPDGMKKNAYYLAKQINVGWNLGNSLEADGSEEAWGNPVTTQEMIQGVKNNGFNAIRIPVRWCVRADDKMNIKAEEMARVKQIVDWALAEDMYVILNSHHDNWYDRLDPSTYNDEEVEANFGNMWNQIATTFKDYDEHLIFGAMNELIECAGGVENWGSYTPETIKRQQKLTQIFVNTVRATGSNNAWRNLMVQPMAASPNFALNADFAMPTDKVADRLILEFHYYQPYSYAGGGATNKFWGAQYESEDGAYINGEQELEDIMYAMQAKFLDNGVPCIMGEFGSVAHIENAKQIESQAYFLKMVVKTAKNYGFPALLWDNNVQGSEDGENMGYLNRNAGMAPFYPAFIEGIMAGAAAGKFPY